MEILQSYDYEQFFPYSVIREQQKLAIEFTLDAFLNKKKRFVILELGTGCGKSAIGVTVARYMNSIIPENDEFKAGAYTLTTQKVLQKQYLNDFGHPKGDMVSIQSATNFQCDFYTKNTCAESLNLLRNEEKKTPFWNHCVFNCCYKQAKKAFIESKESITNFSYFFAETAYGKQIVPRNLLVVDECLRDDAKIMIDLDKEVSMSEVYRNHDITHVISFNDKTSKYERKKILRRIRTSYDKMTDWFKISLICDNKTTDLVVTANHKIWTQNRGYVRADELNLDDVLKFETSTKTNVTRSYVGKHAITKLLSKRKNIFHTCEFCNKVFETYAYERHLKKILCIRKCKNELCENMLEIKQSNHKQIFCSHDCYSTSDVTAKKRSKYMLANNPMKSAETVEKMKKAWAITWEEKSETEKQEQITRFIRAPLHDNRTVPNKLENFVLSLNIPDVKFTGLGDKWVTFKNGKHKNPDFIIEGTHKVIEIGDEFFWHTREEIEDVKEQYAKIGYECLYITNKEMLENIDDVKLRIRKFVFNHDVKISSIKKLNKPKHFKHKKDHFKYNLEIEDNHNFFANSILVSNCHNIESELGKFVEITFSEKFAKDTLKLEWPSMQTQNAIFKWIKNVYLPKLQTYIEHIAKMIKERKEIIERLEELMGFAKTYDMLDKHMCKINRFVEMYDNGGEANWVMNLIEADGKSLRKAEFKPVDVSPYSETLFRFGKHTIMMSATIVDKDTFCKSIGVPLDQVEFLSVDSPFPVENRPIMYMPAGSMAKEDIENSLPKLVEMIKIIMDEHKNEKGIIHAHTYKIASYIKKNIKDSRLLIHDQTNREEIIKKHIESKKPTILLSPSLAEGIDLKDDLSRWQVICKIPFPFLGDKIVRKRMHKDKNWYPYQTAKSIVQSIGRSIRNENDHAVSYILDENWDRFFEKNEKLFPDSFKASIQK